MGRTTLPWVSKPETTMQKWWLCVMMMSFVWLGFQTMRQTSPPAAPRLCFPREIPSGWPGALQSQAVSLEAARASPDSWSDRNRKPRLITAHKRSCGKAMFLHVFVVYKGIVPYPDTRPFSLWVQNLPLGQDPSPQRNMRQDRKWHHNHPVARKAGGTYHTGMLSCCIKIFIITEILNFYQAFYIFANSNKSKMSFGVFVTLNQGYFVVILFQCNFFALNVACFHVPCDLVVEKAITKLRSVYLARQNGDVTTILLFFFNLGRHESFLWGHWYPCLDFWWCFL